MTAALWFLAVMVGLAAAAILLLAGAVLGAAGSRPFDLGGDD